MRPVARFHPMTGKYHLTDHGARVIKRAAFIAILLIAFALGSWSSLWDHMPWAVTI